MPDLTSFSDQELDDYIRDLDKEIAVNIALLEQPKARRQRTIKLTLGSAIAIGGLATIPAGPLGPALVFALVAAGYGLYEMTDAVRDDAAAMNTQINIQNKLHDLRWRFEEARAEYKRRHP